MFRYFSKRTYSEITLFNIRRVLSRFMIQTVGLPVSELGNEIMTYVFSFLYVRCLSQYRLCKCYVYRLSSSWEMELNREHP